MGVFKDIFEKAAKMGHECKLSAFRYNYESS